MSLNLDTTGLAVANFVNGEAIAVTPANLATFGCVFLNNSPFFGKNFNLSFLPENAQVAQAMSLGVDYDFAFELPGFGTTVADKVWGAVVLYNQNLRGTLTASYQALGGNWSFDLNAIRNYLSSNQYNSNTQNRILVSRDPLFLPNNPSVQWPLNSIQSILIAQAQLPLITLSILFSDVSGADAQAQKVFAEQLPLPEGAAKENGGNLDTIAAAMGTEVDAANMPAGGSGMLGWLSALMGGISALGNSLQAVITRLAQPFAVTQSGNWGIQLSTGANTIGAVYPAALNSIVDTTSTAGFTYVCEAPPGTAANAAAWRIVRINNVTGESRWAGTGAFNQVANDRTSLTYA